MWNSSTAICLRTLSAINYTSTPTYTMYSIKIPVYVYGIFFATPYFDVLEAKILSFKENIKYSHFLGCKEVYHHLNARNVKWISFYYSLLSSSYFFTLNHHSLYKRTFFFSFSTAFVCVPNLRSHLIWVEWKCFELTFLCNYIHTNRCKYISHYFTIYLDTGISYILKLPTK